jgi:hypothetical protein
MDIISLIRPANIAWARVAESLGVAVRDAAIELYGGPAVVYRDAVA